MAADEGEAANESGAKDEGDDDVDADDDKDADEDEAEDGDDEDKDAKVMARCVSMCSSAARRKSATRVTRCDGSAPGADI